MRTGGPELKEDLELKRKNGIEAHGVVMDPKFKNLEKYDYRITNKKLIKATGFKPFDVSIENFGMSPKEYPKAFRTIRPYLTINNLQHE